MANVSMRDTDVDRQRAAAHREQEDPELVERVECVGADANPFSVLVIGSATNSATAASGGTHYQRVRVGHVEAA